MKLVAKPSASRHMLPLTKGLSLLDTPTLILLAAFLGLLATRNLVDPDYFWHLKTGEFIVTTGALPSGEIFSHARLGEEWVLHEWLFEVILYAVHSVGGDFAVMLMTSTLGLLAVMIVSRCAHKLTGSFTATLLATALAFLPIASSATPRPQLVTYCLAAYYVSVLISFKYHKTNVPMTLLPALMILWVNSHGGYVLGLALLFAFTASEWIRIRFYAASAASADDRARLTRLTCISFATLAASLVNPDFVWHWVYPVMVLNMKVNALILEWQSPNFQQSGAAQGYLLMVSAFVLACIYAQRKRDITEIAIPGMFLLAGFVSSRHMPLAALIATPFLALALQDGILVKLNNWWHGQGVARAVSRIPGASRELGQGEFVLNWTLALVLVIAFITLRPAFERQRELLLLKTYPVKAVDYIIANHINGKMFNHYNHGGYLIYRLAPVTKVLIDGRADVYGDDFILDYDIIDKGRQGWRERLARLDIDFAIVSVDAPIRQLLIHVEGFQEVYMDGDFSVLLRDLPAPSITQH